MRIGSAAVVVLSLLAIAAAATPFVDSTPSAPTASPIDDECLRPTTPPAPLLSAAMSTSRRQRGARDGSWFAAAADCTSATDQIEMALALATPEQQELMDRAKQNAEAVRELCVQDPVTRRIVSEWERLARFKDDVAVLYVDLSDEDYRARQLGSRPATHEHSLPDRAPASVYEWLGELIDLSGSQVPDELQAIATVEIHKNRQRAARAYQLERARLATDSIREYARNRDARKLVESEQDVNEFLTTVTAWERRRAAWFAADEHEPGDAQELAEIVRTFPSRIWAKAPHAMWERLRIGTGTWTLRFERSATWIPE